MSNVELIGITQPTMFTIRTVNDIVEERRSMTAEELIAYCARVSNPANQDNPDSERLLKYLVKNKHWSPFEMVHIVMEINTTRDIARQILRHRSFSFQEFSQRYAEIDSSVWTARKARLQDQKNRQNSIDVEDDDLQSKWTSSQREVWLTAIDEYNWAIKNGIAKEVARSVLPEGLTMSRMYMSGSLRSWIHYCELRMGNGTQKEHRLIAEQCWNTITEKFPSLKNVLD